MVMVNYPCDSTILQWQSSQQLAPKLRGVQTIVRMLFAFNSARRLNLHCGLTVIWFIHMFGYYIVHHQTIVF